MIIKYPHKNEKIFTLNPVLGNYAEFVAIGEIKMRFVCLVADKVDSPFLLKEGEQLYMSAAKAIPELWSGNVIKDEYINTIELRDKSVVKAIKKYDELFNPDISKRLNKRIDMLNKLSDQQDAILNYAENIKEDHKDYIKYQTESSNLIKNGILRKTTEEIEYYQKKLVEKNVLPIEFLARLEGNKEEETRTNNFYDTADFLDICKI